MRQSHSYENKVTIKEKSDVIVTYKVTIVRNSHYEKQSRNYEKWSQ